MKKFIYNIAVLAMGLFTATSCSPDFQGSEPGNDSKPAVTVYTYAAERPLNPENDMVMRVAANSKVNEAYYLIEKTEDAEARIASNMSTHMDYVVSNGTKIQDMKPGGIVDVNVTDLYGSYTISVVGVNNNEKCLGLAEFTGLEWIDVAEGTYYFSVLKKQGVIESTRTLLQVCKSDKNLYRFKDLFEKGYSLKFSLLPDFVGTDDGGNYTFIRVADQELPDSYKIDTYGGLRVRDIGYWQGSDAWVTEKGYQGGMYDSKGVFLCVQYRATTNNGASVNKSFSYGYDEFVVD